MTDIKMKYEAPKLHELILSEGLCDDDDQVQIPLRKSYESMKVPGGNAKKHYDTPSASKGQWGDLWGTGEDKFNTAR